MSNLEIKAFTLIELMIVIAIIGVLAAIAMPKFQEARERGRTAACQQNLNALQENIELFHLEKKSYPGTFDEFLTFSPGSAKVHCPKDQSAPQLPYNYFLTESLGVVYCGLHELLPTSEKADQSLATVLNIRSGPQKSPKKNNGG